MGILNVLCLHVIQVVEAFFIKCILLSFRKAKPPTKAGLVLDPRLSDSPALLVHAYVFVVIFCIYLG